MTILFSPGARRRREIFHGQTSLEELRLLRTTCPEIGDDSLSGHCARGRKQYITCALVGPRGKVELRVAIIHSSLLLVEKNIFGGGYTQAGVSCRSITCRTDSADSPPRR